MYPEHNVGWHRDKGLKDDLNTIVTVSIGAPRKFKLRDYNTKKVCYDNYLYDGDIVVMFKETNINYEHSIAKAYKKDDQSPRISFTFRVL